MEVISFILQLIIATEFLVIAVFISKKLKQQPKDEKLSATEKMVKKILLNTKWDNIDDVIRILRHDSIHINYQLSLVDSPEL